LGWLVPDPGTPLVIIAAEDQDLAEVGWQAVKVGYENLTGTLTGGIGAWAESGEPTASTPLITAGQVEPASVIDVRQASEYASGHLPGARSIELGALAAAATRTDGTPVVTMCGHGERATTAASVLERAGFSEVAVLRGGPEDWADTTGSALEVTA